MKLDKYNDIVKQWINGVIQNKGKNAELTLKYCNDIVEYAQVNNDGLLLGFAYFHLGETAYCLNDGGQFFETMTMALSYLHKEQEWEYVAKCYNFLGIAAMNRGNASIALDYYLSGIRVCEENDLADMSTMLYVNIGALNLGCGRFAEAEEFLQKGYEKIKKNPAHPQYHYYMICIYENLVKSLMGLGQFEKIEEIQERVRREHLDHGDELDYLSVYCNEAIYFHLVGKYDLRDERIRMIDTTIPDNMTVLDMFDDWHDYLRLLLMADMEEPFWHIVEILEPLVNSFNIINLYLRIISLKMRYYRKHGKNAEYLQAAGLYYELSERMEEETRSMMNNIMTLRLNLEKAREENKMLQVQSETDALTQLPNRFSLNEYTDEAFNRAYENGESLAVCILDIDYFKEFNDNYGHQLGDECIRSIAGVIKEVAVSHKGFCARYGGDEFVVIYEGVTKEEAFAYEGELKERVMELALEHRYSKALPIVTISQGMCWDIPVKGNKLWDFLHIADTLLYRVKRISRNDYCLGQLKESDDVFMIGSKDA